MEQGNRFSTDMLDWDDPAGGADRLWRAGRPTEVLVAEGVVRVRLPFVAGGVRSFVPDAGLPVMDRVLEVRAYGPEILRLSIAFDESLPATDSPMLEWDPGLGVMPLSLRRDEQGFEVLDSDGLMRLRLPMTDPPIRPWSDLVAPPPEALAATVLPDGRCPVTLWDHDSFYPAHLESVGLGALARDREVQALLFSVQARPDERFAGTGERFARLDLSGRTLLLSNTDALGTNSRRAYKNMPFVLSSRGYGLLIHTSAQVRLSLADISTRAVQARSEEPLLDLFVLGGGTPERVLHNLRRVSGFPRRPPLWSLGIWMSRMTYYSAEETREVAHQLRRRGLPCDVLHLDTGWFPENWKCEWEFSEAKFPDARGFLRELREQGFRVSLWNHPVVEPNNKYFEQASENRYLAPRLPEALDGTLVFGRNIDFTYPEAVRWYQGLLRTLLELGAACIKTDFGEDIDMQADYLGLPAARLHNLYALLYQRAAFEVTREVTGEPLIWARAGWLGCQRYPVHWAGDGACTWDGLAGTLRGGLHLGLSGYGYWSHDVPGFHGLPNFMNTWPDPDLYLRWTQFGVFCSHLRYHGTSPREPYRYPSVTPLVQAFWRLRYALIPYLWDQCARIGTSGYPLLRAFVMQHPKDPTCWQIDDAFYCGDSLLIYPVMDPSGVRNVYLPEGRYVCLWTGELVEGGRWLPEVSSPLHRLPIFAPQGATIRVYPERVDHTGQMDLAAAVPLCFDEHYRGLVSSVLGKVSGLE